MKTMIKCNVCGKERYYDGWMCCPGNFCDLCKNWTCCVVSDNSDHDFHCQTCLQLLKNEIISHIVISDLVILIISYL